MALFSSGTASAPSITTTGRKILAPIEIAIRQGLTVEVVQNAIKARDRNGKTLTTWWFTGASQARACLMRHEKAAMEAAQ